MCSAVKANEPVCTCAYMCIYVYVSVHIAIQTSKLCGCVARYQPCLKQTAAQAERVQVPLASQTLMLYIKGC